MEEGAAELDIRAEIQTSVDEIDTYYTRMLNKEVYNKTGLIYGIGHAVYTISDPRALLLKELCLLYTSDAADEL